ncbi:hypothetical protein BD779DRAFT_1607686 [Infundibulicybe gibba]|nr:hypothetical protein BD779DRAFT_1607686 [Infundibulicybe gibba]
MNPQLNPLEWDSSRQEPFLRLKGHNNIVITPPRMSDAIHITAALNDPRIFEFIKGPPYPYLPEHAQSWLTSSKRLTDAVLSDLESAKDSNELKIVGDCPVTTIREVKEDGEDIFLGNISFQRCPYGEFMGSMEVNVENKDKHVEVNSRREPGDPAIIWSLGYYLIPSHHGRGIMSDTLFTMLHGWVIPRMGACRILVSVYVGNGASLKVFLKNGFSLTQTREDHLEVKGRMRGVHVLEWKLT